MKKVIFIVIILLFIFAYTMVCYGEIQNRDTFLFAKLNYDAVSSGMADTIFSNLSVNNPSIVSFIYRDRLSVGYLHFGKKIFLNSFSYDMPYSWGNISFGASNLTYDEVIVSESIGYGYDTLCFFTYSNSIKKYIPIYSELIYYGVNLKVNRSSIANKSSFGLISDVSAIFNFRNIINFSNNVLLKNYQEYFQNFKFCLAYRNFGTKINSVFDNEKLPSSFDFAVNYVYPDFYNLNICSDFRFPVIEKNSFSLGFSLDPLYFLSLRCGYKLSDDKINSGFTFGLGLNFENFLLNYAYRNYSEISNYLNRKTHIFSVVINFGSWTKKELAIEYYLKNDINRAYDLYKRGEYFLALGKIEGILSMYPKNEMATQLLGKIERKIEELRSIKEEVIKEKIVMANKLKQKGNLSSAQKLYNEILWLDSDNEAAINGIKETETILQHVNELRNREKNAKQIISLWNEAIAYYNKFELIEAKKRFEQILKIDPNNNGIRKYLLAIEKQIEDIEQKRIDELVSKGKILFEDEEYEKAKKVFESILESQPENEVANEYMSKIILKLEPVQAFDNLTMEEDKVRNDLENLQNEAIKKYAENEYFEALKLFRRLENLALKNKNKEFATKYLMNAKNHIKKLNEELHQKYRSEAIRLQTAGKLEEAIKNYEIAKEYSTNELTSDEKWIIDTINELKNIVAEDYYKKGLESWRQLEKTKEELSKKEDKDGNYEIEKQLYNNIKKETIKYFEKALYYKPNHREAMKNMERVKNQY